MTLRSIGLALFLAAAAVLSGLGGGSGGQAASGLLVLSLRELTAMLPAPSSPAEPAASVTAGLRG